MGSYPKTPMLNVFWRWYCKHIERGGAQAVHCEISSNKRELRLDPCSCQYVTVGRDNALQALKAGDIINGIAKRGTTLSRKEDRMKQNVGV